jgi:hypothetical protein
MERIRKARDSKETALWEELYYHNLPKNLKEFMRTIMPKICYSGFGRSGKLAAEDVIAIEEYHSYVELRAIPKKEFDDRGKGMGASATGWVKTSCNVRLVDEYEPPILTKTIRADWDASEHQLAQVAGLPYPLFLGRDILNDSVRKHLVISGEFPAPA